MHSGRGIDISKQKKAEQYGRLQRVALESASEAIVITDERERLNGLTLRLHDDDGLRTGGSPRSSIRAF